MPKQKTSSKPPKAMAWGKASPVLVLAALFDLARIFFVLFWFFGPALAAVYCSSKVSDWVGSLWGLTEKACVAGAAVSGAYISAITIPFGVVMADAVGFAGFLVLGLLVIITNARIFKSNPTIMLRLTGSLGVSIIPLVGAIPVFSFTLRRLYAKQIRVETAARKKWEKEHAEEIAQQTQERQRQAAQFMQARDMQAVQMMGQEAANDAAYNQAANDEKYDQEEIPEEVRRTA